MRELWHPTVDELDLAGVMHALSDPVRLECVAYLADKGGYSTEIGSAIPVHKSTMSHHYRVLREAGITLTTAEGRFRLVRLRREDLNVRFPGLLDAILAALK